MILGINASKFVEFGDTSGNISQGYEAIGQVVVGILVLRIEGQRFTK